MKWHTPLSTVTLAALIAAAPLAAQAAAPVSVSESRPVAQVELPGPEVIEVLSAGLDARFSLSAADKLQLAQLERRDGETLQELKRDPSRAVLLSTLYPGLGQLYVGNDLQRSLWIMGGGTLVIAGSIVGFGLLSGRPAEASTLGNIMIIAVLLGYHLWNIRDAYLQADEHNRLVEQQNRASWLNNFSIGMQRETLSLSWSTSL